MASSKCFTSPESLQVFVGLLYCDENSTHILNVESVPSRIAEKLGQCTKSKSEKVC